MRQTSDASFTRLWHRRWVRVSGATLLGLVLLVSGAVWGLQRWLDTPDFRQRVEAQASAAVGAAVTLGRLEVALWPQPAVEVVDLQVATRPALRARTVSVRPDWWALLRGDAAIRSLRVQGATVPLAALAALGGPGARPAGDPSSSQRWWPRVTELEGVAVVPEQGPGLTVNARAVLDSAGWPVSVSANIEQGRWAGSRLRLRADDAAPAAQRRWWLTTEVGGGTVQGTLDLVPGGPAQGGGARARPWRLEGTLATRGVEVSALTAPSRPLSGRLEADTVLRASAVQLADLADALSTQTRFTVRDAALHGLDLVKAVKSVGLSRGGETRLDTLAGQVATQGQAVTLSQLVASSGALSATGQVAISPRRALSGRVTVALAAGTLGSSAVGVPLVVGGTLDDPQVTLTRGALLGAALGTAVLPGVGTGAGASLGDRVSEGLKGLFGK